MIRRGYINKNLYKGFTHRGSVIAALPFCCIYGKESNEGIYEIPTNTGEIHWTLLRKGAITFPLFFILVVYMKNKYKMG